MAEDTEEKKTSQTKAPVTEQKPAPAPAQKPAPLAAPAPAPRPAAAPPRPPAPAPAPPPSQPPKQASRRTFVKAVFTVGAILSIIPFVPWGTFLTSSVSSGSAKRTLLQKAVVDAEAKYGPAAGKLVNVNDLSTFAPNNHWVITYPSSGDLSIDAQNPDTFQKYELVRLPVELGGDSKAATDFVAFSKVCVHLWCSPNYNPSEGHQQYECPCHGSIYQLPQKDSQGNLVDGGKAIAGPASLQAFPTNAIPMLTLQADSQGNLYVFSSNRDPSKPYPNDQVNSIEANGDIGYGRDFKSYQNFILPNGKLPADTSELTQEVQ